MSFALMAAGFSEEWVAELAPAQLRHHYEALVRERAARQREQLHIQVSAAALASDGGKLAKSHDSALRDASQKPTLKPEKPAADRPTLDAAAGIERENAQVQTLWRR